jgi:hypothetical protein
MLHVAVGVLLAAHALPGQETRGMIYGRVTDPQGAVVPGVRVAVTNVDTNTTVAATTNDSGYYEANLLIHGNYQVSFEASGFRRLVRRGIVLPMSTRVEVSATLELGPVSESVTVEAAAPLIDAVSASSGRVLDNRTQQALPTSFNNVTILARLTPGVQTNGEVRILDANDQGSSSDYRIAGSVGGNEWAIDGAPNQGVARQVGFLPHTDVVAEMKIETAGFEASVGHTTGAVVSLVSKAGTNEFHGSANFQHIQNRWNAANFFTAQLWSRQIAEAEAKGDYALAQQLRNTPKQPGGLKNYWAGTLGGPVWIPKVLNGRDRLFFFFSYYGKRWSETTSSQYLNHTFPTLADREGNFAPHLLADAVRYQIHDPLSVKPDPARPTQYIRDPFPGNILPKSRINNPAYSFYSKIIPIPNNNPTDPSKEPLNNWLAVAMPWTADYIALTNRIDFHQSAKHRFYGRWLWDNYDFDRGDYTFETMPGLLNSRAIRDNLNWIGDWVWTPNPATLLDASLSMHRYRVSNSIPTGVRRYKPSDLGLPAYLDQKAGDWAMIPYMSASGYSCAIGGCFGWAAPSIDHYRQSSLKADASHVRSRHTMRAGTDVRLHSRAGGGGGYVSGSFAFDNSFTRRNSDTLTPAGSIAHSWAALMMGLPSGMSIATNDTYYMSSPFAAWYVQDTWRATPRLTLTYGLRLEYEIGPRERFDRMLARYDASLKLPISDAAQAAYAARPLAERPASDFTVRGGTVYAGKTGGRNWWESELMWLPRFGAAWQVAPKTVVRGGWGLFFDTLNAMLNAPNQTGFSRSTSTVVTTDFGYNWLAGNPRAGVSPLNDPFPVRSDGTRFDVPLRDALGSMALAGGSFSYYDARLRHARQQRWRVGVQRQLGGSIVIEAAYAGSHSDRNYLGRPLNPLAEKYWADGLVRNNAVASNLSQNLPNPFLLSNFAALQSSLPVVYQDMSTKSFFRSSTIGKAQLLRPYPHMGTLTLNGNDGEVRTDELQLSFERRFAQGFNLYVAYTRMRNREADYFHNEFDPWPTWRDSNDSRPHRLIGTSVVELPFGKGKPLARGGVPALLLGGFQLGVTYEFQSGALLDFGNLFYYGDLKDIPLKGSKTFARWFNTANFERNASKAPASYHRRVFPTRVADVRADWTNHWSGSLQREFRFLERLGLQFRMDVLNLLNRTQMAAPVTNPLATNFAECTQQAWTTKRFLQFQLRLAF